MSALYFWACGRLLEITTWVGLALITVSQFHLSSTNPEVQQGLDFFNHYAPTIGAALVAMTEKRHREGWQKNNG